MAKPTGYTRLQVRLHWIIALLIIAQFVLNEGIENAWDKIEKGGAMEFSPLVAAHVGGGILILLLALWRISVKIKLGSPALPENEPKWQKIAAHATHGFLYLLLILIPLSGLSAWFGGILPAAEAHEFLAGALMFLVALHFAAAMYHHFVLKTDILRRMLKGQS